MGGSSGPPARRSSASGSFSSYTLVIGQAAGSEAAGLLPRHEPGALGLEACDAQQQAQQQQQQLDAVYARVSQRILPVLMAMIALNYLDRTSLAFASIQMTQQLGFSPAVYGLASGLFFLPYCLLQVPSNMMALLVGVRRWLSGLMLLWGGAAAAFAAVREPWKFYALRLLLGVAEAGSFPGVWLAIGTFFPPDRASLPFALMGTSVAISQVVAAPLAAGLLRLDGVAGLAGWQWVFIGEGVPSVLLALALPWLLPDSLEHITFLHRDELLLLQADHAAKAATANSSSSSSSAAADVMPCSPSLQQRRRAAALSLGALTRVARDWHIWYLAFCFVLMQTGIMALMLWLPVMVHALLSGGDPTRLVNDAAGSSTTAHPSHGAAASSASDTGSAAVLLTALPFSFAAAATALVGAHAQRTGEVLHYFIIPAALAGASFIAFHVLVHVQRFAGFACLVLTMGCSYASAPHVMTLVSRLAGADAPVALPFLNSLAMLGGFFGPSITGWLAQRLGGFDVASVVMGGSMLASAAAGAALRAHMMRDAWGRGIVTGKLGAAHKAAGDGPEYSALQQQQRRPPEGDGTPPGVSPRASDGDGGDECEAHDVEHSRSLLVQRTASAAKQRGHGGGGSEERARLLLHRLGDGDAAGGGSTAPSIGRSGSASAATRGGSGGGSGLVALVGRSSSSSNLRPASAGR